MWDTCVGINFPLIFHINNGFVFENWWPEIVIFHAYKLQGESLYAFSEFGVVSVVAYIILGMERICRREKDASVNSKYRDLRVQRGEEYR
jgi:hypothetical protein